MAFETDENKALGDLQAKFPNASLKNRMNFRKMHCPFSIKTGQASYDKAPFKRN
jgi:hypothetical protein